MTALVTVAIPTYNRVETLRRAVDSVRAQDYPHLEILICDNASEDETESYCRALSIEDPRIVVLRQRENVGASRNFASAAQRARGEFFMWLADDDWLDRNYVNDCLTKLLADPTAVLAGTGGKYYNGDTVVIEEGPIELLASSPEQRVLDYFWKVRSNATFYGLYRLAWIREIPIGERFGEDWHFVAEAVVRGRVLSVPTAVIHRTRGGLSDDLPELARRFGVPEFMADRPFAMLAWNALRQIVPGDGHYSRIPVARRAALGARVAATILGRFNAPRWYARYAPRRGMLRRFIGAT